VRQLLLLLVLLLLLLIAPPLAWLLLLRWLRRLWLPPWRRLVGLHAAMLVPAQ
jgi:hypothetical protein